MADAVDGRLPDPNDTLVALYWQVYQELQRTAINEWLTLNLSMAQLKVLFSLLTEGPMPISAIADMLDKSLPTASHLVERLVRAELVERVAGVDDRRYTLAGLTAHGAALAGRLREGRQSQLRHWLAGISDTERAALHTGLAALAHAVAGSKEGG